MPSKKVLITAGILAITAGAGALAAHSYKSGDDWSHPTWGADHGGFHHVQHWRKGRMWHSELTKEDFDKRTRARFAEMDANGDKVVDATEAKAMIENRMSKRGRRWGQRRDMRRLRRFDTNNDGEVTRAEFDARVAEIFARIDLDSNGTINDMDLPPRLRGRDVLKSGATGDRGRGHRRGARMLKMLRGADANQDGEITREEATAHAAKRFSRLDYNQDGKWTTDDRDALRALTVDYRVKRFFHRFGASGDKGVTIDQFIAHRDKQFARMDRDGDGTVDRDDRRGHRGGPWHGGRGMHRGGMQPDNGGNPPRDGRDGDDNKTERRL